MKIVEGRVREISELALMTGGCPLACLLVAIGSGSSGISGTEKPVDGFRGHLRLTPARLLGI